MALVGIPCVARHGNGLDCKIRNPLHADSWRGGVETVHAAARGGDDDFLGANRNGWRRIVSCEGR